MRMSTTDTTWILRDISARLQTLEQSSFRTGLILDARQNHETRLANLEMAEQVRTKVEATPRDKRKFVIKEVSWSTVWIVGMVILYCVNFYLATPEVQQRIIERTNEKLLDLGTK